MFDPDERPRSSGGPEPRQVRKAVVLGGAGFIGRHLIRTLLSHQVSVTSIDRDPRDRLDAFAVTSIQATLTPSAEQLREALSQSGLDAVFVCAGTGNVPRSIDEPIADFEANVVPLLTALQILAQRPQPPIVVNFSSAAVYGEPQQDRLDEAHPTVPISPYGASKLAAEHYARIYHHLFAVPTISLRLFSVIGPGQSKLVVHDLAKRMLAGENPLRINATPEVVRDYIAVSDVVEAAYQLSYAAPAHGETYNVCSGVGTTLGQLVELLTASLGLSIDAEFSGILRAGDPSRFVGSPASAAALGVRHGTKLASAVDEVADWMRSGRVRWP